MYHNNNPTGELMEDTKTKKWSTVRSLTVCMKERLLARQNCGRFAAFRQAAFHAVTGLHGKVLRWHKPNVRGSAVSVFFLRSYYWCCTGFLLIFRCFSPASRLFSISKAIVYSISWSLRASPGVPDRPRSAYNRVQGWNVSHY